MDPPVNMSQTRPDYPEVNAIDPIYDQIELYIWLHFAHDVLNKHMDTPTQASGPSV
jgi:hypothetical protein